MFKRFMMVLILLTLAVSTAACGMVSFQFGPVNMTRGSGNMITDTRAVSGFNAVQLTTSGDAVIVMGGEENVVIEAEDNIAPLVETSVVNNTLVIGMKPNTSISTMRGMKFTIHAKALRSVELTGSGDASMDLLKGEDFKAALTGSGDMKIGSLEGTNMSFTLTGSGDMKITSLKGADLSFALNGSGDVDAGMLQGSAVHVRSTGSGDTRMAGQAASLDVTLNGSGNFDGGSLKVQTAAATTTGSGNATLWVMEKLDARTSGSGDVLYYGQPTVSQSALGSGRVKGMGNK